MILAGAWAFSEFVFKNIHQMNRKLLRHSSQMEALLHIARAINSSLDLEEILQTVVDQARKHLDADYGELLIQGENGIKIYYSNYDPNRCTVKEAPKMRGLKGAVMKADRPIRLADRTEHPSSVSLPPGHPLIGPFLGVPVKVGGKSIAHIILAREPGRPLFSQDDENTLVVIADQAAVAIEKAKLYQRTQEMAILEERERLAKELHDGLAQTLGYLNVRTLVVKEDLKRGALPEVQQGLDEIREVVRRAYGEIRNAIFDLRATTIPAQGFLPALKEYLHEFSLQTDIKVEVDLDGLGDVDLPLSAQIQLMRIVQESLNNIRKHSGASKVWVIAEATDGTRRLIIRDNGKGFDGRGSAPPREPHFGLQIMRERAESIGGRLMVESEPGKGTSVIVEIPAYIKRCEPSVPSLGSE